jgi:hypothetical protein
MNVAVRWISKSRLGIFIASSGGVHRISYRRFVITPA